MGLRTSSGHGRRLSRPYFLRLIHDHAYSNGILNYRLSGAKVSPIDAFKIGHLLLHGLRNGLYSMRSQWAEARGQAAAARFVAKNLLRPIQCSAAADHTPVPHRVDQVVASENG